MTKIKDGSGICNRKLRVHLSRLKTPTIHANSGKTVSKQSYWERNPFVQVHKIPSLECCRSPPLTRGENSSGAKKYPRLVIINGKSPTLALTKVSGHRNECRASSGCARSDRDISLDKYSVEANFDQPPIILRQVYPSSEGSRSKTYDHRLKRQIWGGRTRSDCMTEEPRLSLNSHNSSQMKGLASMRNRRKHGNVFVKRQKGTFGRNILRTKQSFSSFGGRKNLASCSQGGGSATDEIVSLQKKLAMHQGKSKVVVALKPVRKNLTRTNLASILLSCDQNKQREKPILEDFECDSFKKFKAAQSTKSFSINENSGSSDGPSHEISGVNENSGSSDGPSHEISGVGRQLKKEDKQEEVKIGNRKGRLQYFDVTYKNDPIKEEVIIEGDTIKMKYPPTIKQNDSPGFRSLSTSTEEKLPYHDEMQKLKTELQNIHWKKEEVNADLRRLSHCRFDSKEYSRPKVSLTLRSIAPCNVSPHSQRTPVQGPSDECASIQEIEIDTAVGMPILIQEIETDTAAGMPNLLVGTCEELYDDDDVDDVVIESIITGKPLQRAQITSCISDFLDSSKVSEVPTLEEVKQKLKSVFGRKINMWSHHIEEQYAVIMTEGSAPPSLPIQQDTTLVTIGRYTISQTDISSLDDNAWVNDNIINSYFHLITVMSPLKVYPMSSFFYQVYCKNGFSHVQRWHRKIDLFSHEIILIPVHSRHHWCMVVVNVAINTITFYDSMRHDGMAYLKKIERYMKEEAAARDAVPMDWDLRNSFGIPQQRNYSDCGVFVCQYAKRLGFNKHVIFSHREAADFRREMKRELLTKELET